MPRCISVREVGEPRKYCSFQLQTDVVIVSCRETQTKDGRGLVCTDIHSIRRMAYILNHYVERRNSSMKLLFVFIKSALPLPYGMIASRELSAQFPGEYRAPN